MITSVGRYSAWSAQRITTAPCKQTKPGYVKCNLHRNLGASVLKPSTVLYHEEHVKLSLKHSQGVRDVVGNMLRRRASKEEEEDCLMDLKLIDAIQRLGLDHVFREEIGELIERHYNYIHVKGRFRRSVPPSLQEVSLSFRLLRQEGHFVSPDVFKNFMDEKGELNHKITETNDIEGLMGLYEAAQLSIEGEDILDAAAKLSSQLLSDYCLSGLEEDDARLVKHTLKHPYRKSSAIPERRNSITTELDEATGINGVGKCLQELSYAENFIARSIHGQELHQISKWWEKLDIIKDLEHARNQPMKWYAWSTACLKDQSLSDERVDLTKTISFIYLIDDIFDLYGKPEDLDLFTQAVKRWDLAAIEMLPDYMKKCFRALYVFTNEAALNIQKKHGFNPIESLRETWGDLCNAFLIESRWFSSGSKNLPKADEYLENAKISSGFHVGAVHVFFLLGFGTEKIRPVTLDDASGIISSVATILRLWDDLGSSEDEGQNGFDGSFINYYLNDHKGASIEHAREQVSNMISNEWKKLNEECLRLDKSSSSFQKGILNLARMVPLMYNYNGKEHLPDLQHYIKVMLEDDL